MGLLDIFKKDQRTPEEDAQLKEIMAKDPSTLTDEEKAVRDAIINKATVKTEEAKEAPKKDEKAKPAEKVTAIQKMKKSKTLTVLQANAVKEELAANPEALDDPDTSK